MSKGFEDHFREQLLKRGVCTAAALEAADAIRQQRAGKTNPPTLGEVLIEMGVLTREQADATRNELLSRLKGTPQIPGYKITGLLRTVGQVRVFSGHQESVDREVELRVLTKTALDDPGALELFQREARLIAGLNHKGISGAIDMGETPTYLYLILHHFRGRRLSEILAATPVLPAPTLLELGHELSEALNYLHSKGLAHGRICPENIIVTDEGQAILTGFDLICENGLYHPGHGDNRPRYHTPGLEKQTAQVADLYCFGCTLFEAATGRNPMQTVEESEHHTRPVALKYNFKTGQRLTAIIYTLMSLSPRRPYKFITALQRDFELARSGHHPINAEKLPGVWGRRIPVFPLWPVSRTRAVLLCTACAVVGLCGGAALPLWLKSDELFAPSLSAETAAQEHWQEPVKFGNNADPARMLWLAAEKNFQGTPKDREQAVEQYRKLIETYPAHAYARYALKRLKALQK